MYFKEFHGHSPHRTSLKRHFSDSLPSVFVLCTVAGNSGSAWHVSLHKESHAFVVCTIVGHELGKCMSTFCGWYSSGLQGVALSQTAKSFSEESFQGVP